MTPAQTRRLRSLARAGILMAILALSWQLGALAWRLALPPEPAMPRPEMAPLPAARPDPAQVAQVFGETPPGGAPAGPVETTLPIKLEGIMLSEDPASSRAFIAERSEPRRPQSYRPGDVLPGGGRLTEVLRDHLRLEQGGREALLHFDAPASPGAATGPAPGLPAPSVSFSGATLAAGLQQLGLLRSPEGHVVIGPTPSELVQRYRLRPGDRIISLNGQAIGVGPDADQRLATQLQQSGSARVEIRRGEQTLILEQKF